MKSAKYFWKEKFQEDPQTDADRLAVVMMAEYASQFKPKWISVKDRMPDIYKPEVLNFKGNLSRVNGNVTEGCWDGESWGSFALLYGINEKISVTHWQPLPEAIPQKDRKPEIIQLYGKLLNGL